MYSVQLGFDAAVKRVESLLKASYNSEALVTSVFTAEKTLRRTLKQLIVSAGFISRHATEISGNIRGLRDIGRHWQLYDPEHRTLVVLLGNPDWQVFTEAAKMRNDMIHGASVYPSAMCIQQTKAVLAALRRAKKKFDDEYGYSGWTSNSIRKKSALHGDPRIKKT
ncbi:MAG: hypothetical protein ABR611_04890 [Chthoniobacterales bacterium]